MRIETPASPLTVSRIGRVWWPLAASWLLMGAEVPTLSAIVARLPNPEINLAAYGGVVFPLALIIESPIIMLLAASTALSQDWASYLKIRRYMMIAGASLTPCMCWSRSRRSTTWSSGGSWARRPRSSSRRASA